MKKILLIGPLPPPFNGQSIAFSYLKKLQIPGFNFDFFNTCHFNKNILNYLSSLIVLPFKIIFSKNEIIYFLGSRSKYGFLMQLPLFFSAIFRNIKMINHLHGADFRNFFNQSGLLKPLIFFCYNRVHSSIVLLKEMDKEFVDFPKMKIIELQNAYEECFDQIEVDFQKSKSILYLSNIMSSKGILEFLDAAKLLLNHFNDLSISIAGDFVGDKIKSAKQIKSVFNSKYNNLKTQFKNRITYLGVVTGKEKLDVFLKSSIFVLPTYYPTEAFPISIIEAMRTGNVIITTNHNYLKYIVNEENGLLIKKKSVKAIVNAVIEIFDDYENLKKTQKNNIKLTLKQNNSKLYLDKFKKVIIGD